MEHLLSVHAWMSCPVRSYIFGSRLVLRTDSVALWSGSTCLRASSRSSISSAFCASSLSHCRWHALSSSSRPASERAESGRIVTGEISPKYSVVFLVNSCDVLQVTRFSEIVRIQSHPTNTRIAPNTARYAGQTDIGRRPGHAGSVSAPSAKKSDIQHASVRDRVIARLSRATFRTVYATFQSR